MNSELRKQAEALLEMNPDEMPELPTRDVQALLHELQVHHAELEIQNEELRSIQQDLIEARDRYMSLYQSIPVGYLTLDARRTIMDANAAAEGLLNVSGGKPLTGQRLDAFVAPADADTCYLHLRQVAASGSRQRKDLHFRRADGAPVWIDVETQAVFSKGSQAEFRLTLRDINDRKLTEVRLLQEAVESQATNVALNDSCRTALNLMEDAVEARREAEQANVALLASEQRILQALHIGHAFTFVWQLDTDGVVRSASCGPILGLVGNDVCSDTGQRYFQRVHPDDRARFVQMLRALSPASDTYTTEYRVTRDDGSVVKLEETGKAVFGDDGQLRQVFGVTSDITGRKRAEDQMHFQSRLLQAVGQPLVSTDLEQRITYWNQAAATLFGWTAAEVLGRSLTEVTRPEPLPEGEPDFMAIFGRGEAWSHELLLHRRDGTRVPMLTTNAPVFDTDGKLSAVIGVGLDLTERKLVEDVFRFLSQCGTGGTDERFFRELARYLSLSLKMDFVCIDRLEEGLQTARTLGVFTNGDFEDNVTYALKDTPCGSVLEQGICCYPQGVRSLFPDDTVLQELRAESYLGTLLRSAQGAPIGLIALIGRSPLADPRLPMSVLQVVAVRAAGELERQQAERQIKQLNADLERRVAARTTELEATNRELEAFCYSVSHDLRAPLRSLDGFSQILLEDYGAQLDEAGRDCLSRIRAGSQRMAKLIDDLLRLSRLTRAQMHVSPVDLTALARAALDELRQSDPARRVDCRIAEGLCAQGDPTLLGMAVMNLLQNAWKFTLQRLDAVIEMGQIDLNDECAKRASWRGPLNQFPVYFVRDNGVGFDPQYADKLFSPFQRLHSMECYPGSGVGLATVQRVIHRHGGTIWFEAAPDQGATFFFTLGAQR